MKIDFGEV